MKLSLFSEKDALLPVSLSPSDPDVLLTFVYADRSSMDLRNLASEYSESPISLVLQLTSPPRLLRVSMTKKGQNRRCA